MEALRAQGRKDKDQEIAELVVDLDQAAADKDAGVGAHAEEITRLEAQRGAIHECDSGSRKCE